MNGPEADALNDSGDVERERLHCRRAVCSAAMLVACNEAVVDVDEERVRVVEQAKRFGCGLDGE